MATIKPTAAELALIAALRALMAGEDAPAEETTGKGSKPKGKAKQEPEADPIDEMDRAELKALIAEEELDVTITKAMDEDTIRDAIREARTAKGAEGGEESEEEETEEEESEDAPSKDDVRNEAKKLIKLEGGEAALKAIFKKAGAANLNDLDEDAYPAAISAIKAKVKALSK